MKSVTLRQLRAFAAVAQRSNFARAAHDLHLTPPAVTMQIKELEREVGLPLFDRAAKQIQLTLTGEYLLTYVRRMLAELKNADDMLAQLKRLEGGEVVVGMVSLTVPTQATAPRWRRPHWCSARRMRCARS